MYINIKKEKPLVIHTKLLRRASERARRTRTDMRYLLRTAASALYFSCFLKGETLARRMSDSSAGKIIYFLVRGADERAGGRAVSISDAWVKFFIDARAQHQSATAESIHGLRMYAALGVRVLSRHNKETCAVQEICISR